MTTVDAIRLLLVEDDARLADLTSQYLISHGCTTVIAGSGPAGLEAIARETFDVVLLDLNLPGFDGLDLCRLIRIQSRVPIIMVTARGEVTDRVVGLDSGADDYLCKPFNSRELLSRVRAAVRRSKDVRPGPADTITVGALTINPGEMVAKLHGEAVEVTSHEFALLRALAESAGRPMSRESLLDVLGNGEEAFDRSIDVHISRLRRKLGDDARKPTRLKTVRGLGYVLVADE